MSLPCQSTIPGHEVEGSRPRAAAAFHRLNYRDAPGDVAAPPKCPPVELQGRTVRNELIRLARHRLHIGQGIGHEWSWLETAADVAAATYGADVSAKQVEGVCTRIGLPPQEPGIYERLAASASRERRSAGPGDLSLLDPEVIAKKVELTAEEREGLKIRRIGSFDETPRERKLRHDRERKGAGRERKGAKPHSKSMAATEPWRAMGIGKSTYYARGLHRGRTVSSGSS